MDAVKKKFGKWRSFLWPIHNFELKKLIPMFFLFFFFSFNYMILKDTKEPLVITAQGSGAEALPFLKLWGVLPLAFILMLVYSKLSNILKKQTLFYTTVTFFISFYALFAFVLYPLKDVLHPNEFADKLQSFLPQGFSGIIAVFRNWTFSLFYAMSELWGSVGLSLLFWGFANDITHVNESKRFYNLFGLGSSIAMLFSGPCVIYFSKVRKLLSPDIDAWGISLKHLMSLVIAGGLIIMGIYWWINKYVITDKRFFNPDASKKIQKKKLKMSLKEAFLYLSKSRYMRLLSILVIGYAISNIFIEVVWKSQAKLLFPKANDYAIFRGAYSTITSGLTIIMMLFVGGNVIRRLGWKSAAIITPVVFLITGTGFFTFIIFRDHLSPMVSFFHTTPVILALVFGMIQNMVSKSCKSSLFEPSKEMVYIPLDDESKVKGKAAIDVLMVKLGKAGGSFILQGLIIALGSILAVTPFIAVILITVNIFWIRAVKSLNILIKSENNKYLKEEIGVA